MSYNPGFAGSEPRRAAIDATPGALVLEFGAPWCGHCLAAAPHVEAVLAERADVAHLRVEDGPGQPLGRSFRIKLWPTLVFLRDGVEQARVIRPTAAAPIADALASIA